jgi:plastocyanin
MRVRFWILLAGLVLVRTASAMIWQVYIGNNFFAPESLVVAFGDTVRWTALEGTHNVIEQSDPPLFTSGPPAPAPWSYQFEFRPSLGTYDYVCEVHAPAMHGSVTVVPYGTPPNIEFADSSAPEGATTGAAIRINIRATDENQDLTGYALTVDDTLQWTPWTPLTRFLFADSTLGTMPSNITVVPNAVLTPGAHIIYSRAIDSRGFISPTIQRHITVTTGMRPRMNAMGSVGYGNNILYSDGSAYYTPGSSLSITTGATAASYYGMIHSYRFRNNAGVWDEWTTLPNFTFVGLQAQDYSFAFQARDMAGEFSDTLEYAVHLVAFALGDSTIVIDETRNGNGTPGIPNDAQVDEFYAQALAGFPFRSINYDSTNPAQPASPFVSPYIIRNAGLVLWHSDDRAAIYWDDNWRLIQDYLIRGGRLLLSGWDVMNPYALSGDSIVFQDYQIPHYLMGLRSANRNASRTVMGIQGQNGFPSVMLDSTKMVSAYHGLLDHCWVFQPDSSFLSLGGLAVADSLTNPLAHQTAAYYCESESRGYRVAIFGVPLYFCDTEQAQAMVNMLLPMFFAPSAAPPPPLRPAKVGDFALEQNYPNPFNATTEIRFTLSVADHATVRVYDLLGRLAVTVLDAPLAAGAHRVQFDGRGLASGVYFLELRSGTRMQSRKILLLK